MLLFKVLEVLVTVLIMVVCGTQIILPAYRKTLLFPFFRKQKKLEKERDLDYKLEPLNTIDKN